MQPLGLQLAVEQRLVEHNTFGRTQRLHQQVVLVAAAVAVVDQVVELLVVVVVEFVPKNINV